MHNNAAEPLRAPLTATTAALRTPSSRWKSNGESDPHEGQYDSERAALPLGHMSDDELAYGAFMNYNVFPAPEEIIARRASSPIVWMTAVKDRIRWLSRSLDKALATGASDRTLARGQIQSLTQALETTTDALSSRMGTNAEERTLVESNRELLADVAAAMPAKRYPASKLEAQQFRMPKRRGKRGPDPEVMGLHWYDFGSNQMHPCCVGAGTKVALKDGDWIVKLGALYYAMPPEAYAALVVVAEGA